jgi:hypothetical protein
MNTDKKPTCEMLTHDEQLREGKCGVPAVGRDGYGRALCSYHGELHVKFWRWNGIPDASFTPLSGAPALTQSPDALGAVFCAAGSRG